MYLRLGTAWYEADWTNRYIRNALKISLSLPNLGPDERVRISGF